MKDLLVIKGILLIYVLLFASCIFLWGKDLILYLIYNQQPTKFTIILSLVITLLSMIKLFIQYSKSLVDWNKV
jgi:glucan phosphoethanolaminetransferase (alkaline phosphatase superfamily)